MARLTPVGAVCPPWFDRAEADWTPSLDPRRMEPFAACVFVARTSHSNGCERDSDSDGTILSLSQLRTLLRLPEALYHGAALKKVALTASAIHVNAVRSSLTDCCSAVWPVSARMQIVLRQQDVRI